MVQETNQRSIIHRLGLSKLLLVVRVIMRNPSSCLPSSTSSKTGSIPTQILVYTDGPSFEHSRLCSRPIDQQRPAQGPSKSPLGESSRASSGILYRGSLAVSSKVYENIFISGLPLTTNHESPSFNGYVGLGRNSQSQRKWKVHKHSKHL